MITGSGLASAARSRPRASSIVAGATTRSPGTCAYQTSRLCECCAASCRPAPVAMRITTGTCSWPPDMWQSVAALLTIWSSASRLKLTVMTSTIGRMPPIAAPIPAPTNADSDSGVSRMRSSPNSSSRPLLTAKQPPYLPTSSPIRNTRGSAARASRIDCLTASRYVMRVPPTPVMATPPHRRGVRGRRPAPSPTTRRMRPPPSPRRSPRSAAAGSRLPSSGRPP